MRPISGLARRQAPHDPCARAHRPIALAGPAPIRSDPRFPDHPHGAKLADTTTAIRALVADAGYAVTAPLDEHDGVGLNWAWRNEPPG